MRRIRCVVAAGTLMLVAGCGPEPAQGSAEINWGDARRSDANCLDGARTSKQSHDIGGDTEDEIFLIMRCNAKADPAGDMLEVVVGGVDPATTHPTKLITQVPGRIVDNLCFKDRAAIFRVTVAGKPAVIMQVVWPKGAAEPARPTIRRAGGCPE
ncbi:hypothetical protein [Actinoplanes sp. NPDC026619]|uniref:hypothetical protein n=1 Tax=Actinoplanes sp. NPDC026619 TaxID=3155798 RepID=UPI0033D1822E